MYAKMYKEKRLGSVKILYMHDLLLAVYLHRGLSELLHDRMRPKCRASEEIRRLFYECSHEKMLVRKHARVEAPVGDRCATICNGSCDMSYVLVRSLCNKSECSTMKQQHRTSNQVIGRWRVR